MGGWGGGGGAVFKLERVCLERKPVVAAVLAAALLPAGCPCTWWVGGGGGCWLAQGGGCSPCCWGCKVGCVRPACCGAACLLPHAPHTEGGSSDASLPLAPAPPPSLSQFGLPPAHYDTWPALRQNFHMLTTSKDRNGVEYVSTAEHKSYPFFATQVHSAGVLRPRAPPWRCGRCCCCAVAQSAAAAAAAAAPPCKPTLLLAALLGPPRCRRARLSCPTTSPPHLPPPPPPPTSPHHLPPPPPPTTSPHHLPPPPPPTTSPHHLPPTRLRVLQWHPEKPPFEFGMKEIPHTLDAILVSQHLVRGSRGRWRGRRGHPSCCLPPLPALAPTLPPASINQPLPDLSLPRPTHLWRLRASRRTGQSPLSRCARVGAAGAAIAAGAVAACCVATATCRQPESCTKLVPCPLLPCPGTGAGAHDLQLEALLHAQGFSHGSLLRRSRYVVRACMRLPVAASGFFCCGERPSGLQGRARAPRAEGRALCSWAGWWS